METKKKALLYFPVSLTNINSGITKKCLGIIDAFKKVYEVDVMNEYDGLVFFNGNKLKDYTASLNQMRFYYYNDFFSGQYNLIKKQIKANKYDVVYFRLHYFVTFGMIRFLKRLKAANSKVNVTVEIPTFPYEMELTTWQHKFRNKLNRITIPALKKYVAHIVTFSSDKLIWDIPTIEVSNGYFSPGMNSDTANLNSELDEHVFHMAMVAQFSNWHAPDILIDSLYEFSLKNIEKKVKVHFVGKPMPAMFERVKELGLENDVVFHGEQSPTEISALLSKVHVCVGTLGHHRKNIKLDSSLKNREYAFSGMPLVLKTADLDFPPELFFVQFFPDDASLLDIEKVIAFYQQLKILHPNYKLDIINYAKENLTWARKLKAVFESHSQLKH